MPQDVATAPAPTRAAPRTSRSTPLLIADGDIPTARIVAGLLRAGFGDVEVRIAERLFGADVDGRHVVVSRLCHPQYGWLPDYLVRRGIRYAYFLDDNFWELTAAVDTHLAQFYTHPFVRRTLDDFIARASMCIVMSPRLGAYVESRLPGVRAPCIVGGFDIDALSSLVAATPRAPKPAGEIRIGYPTTRRSNVAPLLVPVVREIARRHPQVRFEFIGWAPDELAARPDVQLHPHIDDYQRFLAFAWSRQWDIGIAPLVGEAFESYKTNVKYREYGGCRVAGVYSRVPPYVDCVVDEATGLLADNTETAWVAALERLIVDAPLRERIRANAYAEVETLLNQRTSAAQFASLLREGRIE